MNIDTGSINSFATLFYSFQRRIKWTTKQQKPSTSLTPSKRSRRVWRKCARHRLSSRPTHRSRSTRSSRLPLQQLTRQGSRLPRWPRRRPAWVSSRTRSSRTTTRLSISTMLSATQRHAASSKRTRSTASRRSPSRSALSRLSFLQQTRHQQRSLRRLSA